ncbi:MAG: endolytic transglycosylase MltG [Firmicutes bacterium]|nr:endolytic transglycosylase MltG [Bacillota bacterium]MCL5040354.1 endolytic transglycosylase MltG [Bacillota bacterium]
MPARRVHHLLVAGLVLLSLTFWGYGQVLYLLAPANPAAAEKVEVLIPSGASTKEIAFLLGQKGLIKNSFLFRVLVSWIGFDGRLQAGDYLLSPGMTPREIALHLKNGDVIMLSFTIPEGYRVEQVTKLLAEKGFGDRTAFEAAAREKTLVTTFVGTVPPTEEPLEGFLYPDTYRFPKGYSEREIIKMMVDRFLQVFAGVAEKSGSARLTPYETLILASIIEKEAMADEERPLISAVYHNRLSIGMKLDADPTVRYGLKKFTGPLTSKDLSTPSSYNTYLNPGLPPGPIANPGRASLEAALSPIPVDFFYFVSKNDGTHAFSRTYQEHLIAVSKYQRGH